MPGQLTNTTRPDIIHFQDKTLKAGKAAGSTNGRSTRAENLGALVLAVAVEHAVAVQAQAHAAAAFKRKRSVVSIDEKVNAARVGGAVNDLGKPAAGVGSGVGPEFCLQSVKGVKVGVGQGFYQATCS